MGSMLRLLEDVINVFNGLRPSVRREAKRQPGMGSDWEVRAGVGTMRHGRQVEIFHNLALARAARAKADRSRELVWRAPRTSYGKKNSRLARPASYPNGGGFR